MVRPRRRRLRHEDQSRHLGAWPDGHALRSGWLQTGVRGRDHSRASRSGGGGPRRPHRRLRVPLSAGAERGQSRRSPRRATRPRHLLHGNRPAPRPALRARRLRLTGRRHPRGGAPPHAGRHRLLRRARLPLHHLAWNRGIQLPVPDSLQGELGRSSTASVKPRTGAGSGESSCSSSTRTPSPR
jgi:hypothetical protein